MPTNAQKPSEVRYLDGADLLRQIGVESPHRHNQRVRLLKGQIQSGAPLPGSTGKVQVGDWTRERGMDPSPHKGTIFAMEPDPEDVDMAFKLALNFSLYPTQVDYQIAPNVPSEVIAGRTSPAIQNLGGKGKRITLDILFHDAFLPRGTGRGAGEYNYTRAPAAQVWFDVFGSGGDEDGYANPPKDYFFQLGGSTPVQVVLEDITVKATTFNNNDDPQVVRANVTMVRYHPLKMRSPFKPDKPKTRGSRKGKKKSVDLPSGSGQIFLHAALLGASGLVALDTARTAAALAAPSWYATTSSLGATEPMGMHTARANVGLAVHYQIKAFLE